MSEASTGPGWPELDLPHGLLPDTLIAAKILVQGAVFSTLEYAGGAQRPEITEPLDLRAIKPYKIEQVAGVRLSQSDADLFFRLLARAYRKGAPSGDAAVFFKRGEVLSALGRARGGKTDLLLEESLQRLYAADFAYTMPGVVGRTRLLSSVERVESDAKPYDYKVLIAQGVAALLDGGEWLLLHGKVRGKLAGDPLAKGLHAFYSSQERAYPMLPETVQALMSRTSMQGSKWRRALGDALAKVQAATGWFQCEVVKAGPLAGKVVVERGSRRGKRPKKAAGPEGATVATNRDEVQNDEAAEVQRGSKSAI